MSWLERLRGAVENGPGTGRTLVVAVSGGGDSVALLHGLARLRESLDLRLVVAHLDHALRAESAQDAAFVGHLALSLGLPCLRERRDIAEFAADQGLNLEEAARRARYEMLESAALAVNASAIALAHTRDEQAETVLMHVLRGSGLDGLKGMRSVAPSPLPGATVPLFRPLLQVPRAELRAWLLEHELAWQEDSTNLDTTRFRSRLRHELIPILEREQPRLQERLAGMAEILGAENELLEQKTTRAWSRLATAHPTAIRFQRAPFQRQPLAMQRRLLRRAFFTLRPQSRDLSLEQSDQALAIAARGDSGARATLPGHLFLTVEGDSLWVGPEPDTSAALQLSGLVSLPGEGTIHAGGLVISVAAVGREAIPESWQSFPPTTALLDAEELTLPLSLRTPQTDDRWAPLGMGGTTVHLRDWLAKHKVPLSQRDHVPLLVDATGVILWVVGWHLAEAARVRPTSRQITKITVARDML